MKAPGSVAIESVTKSWNNRRKKLSIPGFLIHHKKCPNSNFVPFIEEPITPPSEITLFLGEGGSSGRFGHCPKFDRFLILKASLMGEDGKELEKLEEEEEKKEEVEAIK